MPLRARLLRGLHALSAALVVLSVLLGYAASRNAATLGIHIPAGFASAIVIAFTHAMTMFYFVGTGVSMRDASGSNRRAAALLARADALRRQLVWPLGIAVLLLIAATVLGGGSHTGWLPRWPHEVASWLALAGGLHAHLRSARLISGNEGVIRDLEEVLGM